MSRIASVRVARQEVCDTRRGVTLRRMWMVRPSQIRSRHCGTLVRAYTKVTKERCTAPDWTTEQGKAFALGSGRITHQNPDVHHDATRRMPRETFAAHCNCLCTATVFASLTTLISVAMLTVRFLDADGVHHDWHIKKSMLVIYFLV